MRVLNFYQAAYLKTSLRWIKRAELWEVIQEFIGRNHGRKCLGSSRVCFLLAAENYWVTYDSLTSKLNGSINILWILEIVYPKRDLKLEVRLCMCIHINLNSCVPKCGMWIASLHHTELHCPVWSPRHDAPSQNVPSVQVTLRIPNLVNIRSTAP